MSPLVASLVPLIRMIGSHWAILKDCMLAFTPQVNVIHKMVNVFLASAFLCIIFI